MILLNCKRMIMNDDNEFLEPATFSRATFEISPAIHQRVEDLLYMTKNYCGEIINKQEFVLKAIKEKLKYDKEVLSDKIPKEKFLHYKIDNITLKQLDEKVNLIRKFRRTYSKKQWILEAIQEKLNREEVVIKKMMKETRKPES